MERCEREAQRRAAGNEEWKLAAGHGVYYVPGRGDELLYFSPTTLGSVSISRRWRDTKPHSAGSIRSNHIPPQSAHSADSTKTNREMHSVRPGAWHRCDPEYDTDRQAGRQAGTHTHAHTLRLTESSLTEALRVGGCIIVEQSFHCTIRRILHPSPNWHQQTTNQKKNKKFFFLQAQHYHDTEKWSPIIQPRNAYTSLKLANQ